jgi:hypothetical protein
MKNGISIGLTILAIIWCTCSYAQITENKPGSDRDKHGCIGSAGYQWSEIKKNCVRIFEAGTSFDAYGKNHDSAFAAYVIVSKDLKKVEVFAPAEYLSEPVILNAVAQPKGGTTKLFENSKKKVKLEKVKDKYLIVINGEPVYSQNYSPTEGLGPILKKK